MKKLKISKAGISTTLVAVAAVIIAVAAIGDVWYYIILEPKDTKPELPDLSLTLVALDGTEPVLDESDIAEICIDN